MRGTVFTFRAGPKGIPFAYTGRPGARGELDLLCGTPERPYYQAVYPLEGGILTIRFDGLSRPRPASVDAGGPGYRERYRRAAR